MFISAGENQSTSWYRDNCGMGDRSRTRLIDWSYIQLHTRTRVGGNSRNQGDLGISGTAREFGKSRHRLGLEFSDVNYGKLLTSIVAGKKQRLWFGFRPIVGILHISQHQMGAFCAPQHGPSPQSILCYIKKPCFARSPVSRDFFK